MRGFVSKKLQVVDMIKKHTYSFITETGFVLTILGLPLGTAIRNISPSLELVNIFMFISIICLVDFKNLYRLTFPNFNKHLFIILILQLLFVFYGLFNKNESNEKFIIYSCYCTSCIIALFTHPRGLQTKYFFSILTWVSIIVVIPCLMQSNIGGFQIMQAMENTGDRMFLKEGGDPITTARGVLAAFIGFLFLKSKKSNYIIIFKYLAIAASIIVLLSFYTRTVIFAAIITTILFMWNKNAHNDTYKFQSQYLQIRTLSTIIIFIIIFVLCYSNIEYFSDKVDGILKKMSNGISSFLGKESSDISASARVDMRKVIISDFLLHDSYLRILLGAGINHIFADSPAFQILFDMGFFIGGFYIFYTMYISIKCNMTKNNSENDFFLYIKLLSIVYCIDQIICGWPYFYMNFIPPIFLLYIIYNNRIGHTIIQKRK